MMELPQQPTTTPAPTYPTMLSSFIATLQTILDEEGDMPVTAAESGHRTAKVYAYTDPYYYDGGYLLPTESHNYHCRHWVTSRKPHGWGGEIDNFSGYAKFVRIRAGCPEPAIDEDALASRDTINGEPMATMKDVQ